jgi:hypothetical protein
LKIILYILSILTIGALPFMKIPQTKISNGIIDAKLYLPDSDKGYYKGTRFDRSGNMPSLVFKGHEYFGQWFKNYSPEIHDVIMGPVEEFTAVDYFEAAPGEKFLKIGVGVLTKPDNEAYAFSRLYPVINPGKWSVQKETDQVKFVHELKDPDYSYNYEKIVHLAKGKPELHLSHTFKNTGKDIIETSVYDHNFFVIDDQPIGPGYSIKFPFDLIGEGNGIGELADIEGSKIIFLKELLDGETVFCSNLEGFSSSPKDYDIKIENNTTGAGVRITCEQPLLKLVFWCCATTLCPEPYIKIKVNPGEEFKWEIKYEFYTLDE